MPRYKPPRLLNAESPLQNQRVELCQNGNRYFISLRDILYLRADADYTYIYFTIKPLDYDKDYFYMSYNLGSYAWLLEKDFVRPNENTIINISHLYYITNEGYLKLAYPHKPIRVSKAYRQKLESCINPQPEPLSGKADSSTPAPELLVLF